MKIVVTCEDVQTEYICYNSTTYLLSNPSDYNMYMTELLHT